MSSYDSLSKFRRLKFCSGKLDSTFYFWPALVLSRGEGIALVWLLWGISISWIVDIGVKK
jgi:hypothetical protein